jgi:hypothetical protein
MAKANNGFAVKSHFEGKDAAVRQIYDRLLKVAGNFGPVVEDSLCGSRDAKARDRPDH